MPPAAPAAFGCAHTREGAPPPLTILKRRADFLRAARARRQAAEGFVLQARRRNPDEAMHGADERSARVGFTCSKKVGNAVTRNRAKRRLRALAQAVLAPRAQVGWDYVLIGRPNVTVSRPWAALVDDLKGAISRLHAPRKPRA